MATFQACLTPFVTVSMTRASCWQRFHPAGALAPTCRHTVKQLWNDLVKPGEGSLLRRNGGRGTDEIMQINL